MSKRKNSQYDEGTMEKLWASLENTLSNYEYWRTTSPTVWDITVYDMRLLKKSYHTKRMAHAKLTEDLDAIQATFPKQVAIQQCVKFLRDSLGKCSRDQDNKAFWETAAVQLNQASYQRDVADTKLINSAKEAASSLLDMEIWRDEGYTITGSSTQYPSRPSTPTPGSANKKQRVSQESAILPSHAHITQKSAEFEEVKVDDSQSIAAVIKSNAEAILDKVLRDDDITTHERKVMTNGLSSILDLSDNSPYSQRLYFSADVWKSMNDLYHKKYQFENVTFPAALINTWKIVCHNTKMTRSIDTGLKYLYRIYPKHFDDKSMFMPLKVLEMILTTMNDQHYLLEKQKAIDVTEYDYLGNVWLPLFRELFQKGNIRIKTHESTFAYTTKRKVDQYPASPNVIGFKIDIRFLVDYGGQEYDLCSGEMAKKDDDDKIMSDKAKVNRESKDDLDCMLDICEDEEWADRVAWQFQSAGSTGHLNSIHLAGNGLYVVLGRYDLKFPSSIADAFTALQLLNDLFTWRKEMYNASDFLMTKLSKKHDLRLRGITSPTASHRALQRDTSYSPPEKTTKWQKPASLYGYIPTNIMEKLLAAHHSSRPKTSSAQQSSSCPAHENLVYDANGWAKTDNKWYNQILGEYSHESPYGDDK